MPKRNHRGVKEEPALGCKELPPGCGFQDIQSRPAGCQATIGDYDNVCMGPFHKFKNITKRSNNLLSTRWLDVGNKLSREYDSCLPCVTDRLCSQTFNFEFKKSNFKISNCMKVWFVSSKESLTFSG